MWISMFEFFDFAFDFSDGILNSEKFRSADFLLSMWIWMRLLGS